MNSKFYIYIYITHCLSTKKISKRNKRKYMRDVIKEIKEMLIKSALVLFYFN